MIDENILLDELKKNRPCECCPYNTKATYMVMYEKTGIVQLVHMCEPCTESTKSLDWTGFNIKSFKK